MARQNHDREDLLRDATALVPRVQCTMAMDGQIVHLFAGFRGEALSLYFGADPVYHFNGSGELRRAFVGDRLIKADARRLVQMDRVRTANAVELRAVQLDDAHQQHMLGELRRRLATLRGHIDAHAITVVGDVPPGGTAMARLEDWLRQNVSPAPAPSARVR